MIENYVLSGLFSVVHFLARGHAFSSQMWVSLQLFTLRVSVQTVYATFQFAPAKQMRSHSFYSRGFRRVTSHFSLIQCVCWLLLWDSCQVPCTSRYTNIPVEKCIECFEIHFKKTTLHYIYVKKKKTIKISALFRKHCFLQYNPVSLTKIWFTHKITS